MKTFIIAEAGVNHNGNVNLAKKLIDVAIEAKVDAVKFQTWNTDAIIDKSALKAEYQTKDNAEESQYDMIKRLELSYQSFRELKKYCDKKGIEFLSTPDDLESAHFLNNLQSKFKVGSGELDNLLYLKQIAGFNKPVILSTGIGNLDDVHDAVSALKEGGITLDQLTLLHVTSQYPTPYEEVNLRAMLTLKETFNCRVGYSDHTLGLAVPVAAVTLGAEVIEKHFTLDRTMEGPDHSASLEPDELKQMVTLIRNVEVCLGSGEKVPTSSEIKNREVIRKKVYLRKNLKKGTQITEKDLVMKRTSSNIGFSAKEYKYLIGKILLRDIAVDTLATNELISNET